MAARTITLTLTLALLIALVAAANAADKASPAKAPASGGDVPKVLTPFAQSPGMASSLAEGPSNQIDDDDKNNDALLGSPNPASEYGPRDADASSPSSSAAVCVSSAAASVSVVAGAVSGYLFF